MNECEAKFVSRNECTSNLVNNCAGGHQTDESREYVFLNCHVYYCDEDNSTATMRMCLNYIDMVWGVVSSANAMKTVLDRSANARTAFDLPFIFLDFRSIC